MFLKVELHCHTIYSKDSLTSPQSILSTCRRKGIDRVAITDHNTITGALRAKELDPEMVIVGEEILTTEGELLAFFVQEEIPPGLSPAEAIENLKAQGAFISVSHPFDRMRSAHWNLPALQAIIDQVDAIETFNSRCMRASFNQEAQDFANKHMLQGTVGSDAHATIEIGRALMMLPSFSNTEELCASLNKGRSQTRLSSPLVHLYSRYAVWYKRLTGRK